MPQRQALETTFSHSKKLSGFLPGCTAGLWTTNLEILHTDFLTWAVLQPHSAFSYMLCATTAAKKNKTKTKQTKPKTTTKKAHQNKSKTKSVFSSLIFNPLDIFLRSSKCKQTQRFQDPFCMLEMLQIHDNSQFSHQEVPLGKTSQSFSVIFNKQHTTETGNCYVLVARSTLLRKKGVKSLKCNEKDYCNMKPPSWNRLYLEKEFKSH